MNYDFSKRSLSLQVAMAVFFTIIVIEIIILVPSYNRYKQGLLDQQRETIHATLAVQALHHDLSEQQLWLDWLSLPQHKQQVKGLTVISPNQERLFRYGASPGPIASRNPQQHWLDSPWQAPDGTQVRLRLDTHYLTPSLNAYLLRLVSLILAISLVVTGVTITVLRYFWLLPIKRFHELLVKASQDPTHPGDYMVNSPTYNELEQVKRAFNRLLNVNAHNLSALSEQQARLNELNNKLEVRVTTRTHELGEANQRLQQEIDDHQQSRATLESMARFPDENSNPVLRIQRSGELLYANRSAAPLLESWQCQIGQPIPRYWFRQARLAIEHQQLRKLECNTRQHSYELVLTPVADADYINIYAVDITERKAGERRIYTLAYFDSLTGLPNRSLFNNNLSKEIEQAAATQQSLTLVCLDLDHFKSINDTYGHDVGDQLLRLISLRLRAHAGTPSQAIGASPCARLDGDEFALLITHPLASEGLENFICALINIIAKPIQLDGETFTLHASYGIACYPQHGSNPADLLQHADTAMTQAKQQGRQTWRIYDSSMSHALQRHTKLAHDLRRALEHGELELHYQPKIDLESGQVLGSEALMRWTHPELGPISPVEFIAIAEETQLILTIGDWALRQACSDTQRWRQEGHQKLTVAVNLSARQFNDSRLEQRIEAALLYSGLAPDALELELTESLIMSSHQVQASLKRFKAIGISIAVDDFGTGYSSLRYLSQFPLDILKIDRSFIRNIEHSDRDKNITNTIITLAHSLGLWVVAEGVEDATQQQLLKLMNCDIVQGYHYSRPLSGAAFTQYLHNHAQQLKLEQQKQQLA